MSFDSIVKSHETGLDNRPAQRDTTMGEALSASFDNMVYSQNIDAEDIALRQAREDNHKKFQEITGEELDYQKSPSWVAKKDLDQSLVPEGFTKKELYEDEIISQLKAQDPDKYKDLHTTTELKERGRQLSKEKIAVFESAESRINSMGAKVASFVGSITGAFTDPLNMATLPLGAARGAGLLKTALTEGAINVATEAASFAAVRDYQEQLGKEYGKDQLLQNMVTAGAMGAGFTAGVGAIGKTGRYVFSKVKTSKAANATTRTYADIMEKMAFIKESNPLVKNVDMHEGTLKRMGDALEEGTPASRVDIDVPQKAFIESVHPEVGDIAKVKNMELNQIRGEALVEKFDQLTAKLSDMEIQKFNEAVDNGKALTIHGVDQNSRPFSLDYLGSRADVEKYLKKKGIDMGEATDLVIEPVLSKMEKTPEGVTLRDATAERKMLVDSEVQAMRSDIEAGKIPQGLGSKEEVLASIESRSGSPYKKMSKLAESKLMGDPTYSKLIDPQAEHIAREYSPKNDRAKELGLYDEAPLEIKDTIKYLDEVTSEASLNRQIDQLTEELKKFENDTIMIDGVEVKISDEFAEIAKADSLINAMKVCTI